MAQASASRRVFGALRSADRAALLEFARQGKAPGHIRLRGVPSPAVRLEDEVRQRHGLAELLRTDRGARRHEARLLARGTAYRVPLHTVRRAPGACLQRRPAADRTALVQQWPRAEVPPRGRRVAAENVNEHENHQETRHLTERARTRRQTLGSLRSIVVDAVAGAQLPRTGAGVRLAPRDQLVNVLEYTRGRSAPSGRRAP